MVTKIVNQPLGMGIAGQPVRKEWVAAAIGLGTAVLGGVLASKSAKKAQAEQRKKEAAENAWYNRKYNEDYLDTAAGQRLVNKAKEAANAASKRADAATKVGGGTEAYKAMMKEQGNKMVADTMANVAANDTARKDRVDAIHRQNQERFADQNIQIQNQRAAAITNAAQNASNAIMSMEGIGGTKADLTGSGNNSKVFADRNAAKAVQNMNTTAKADHAKILQTDGDKLPWTGGMWV